MSITPNGTATPTATAVVFDEAGRGVEDDLADSGSVASSFFAILAAGVDVGVVVGLGWEGVRRAIGTGFWDAF